MTRRLLLFASLAVLAACATTPRLVSAPSGAGFELLEPILAARAGADGVTIRVRSHGCTAKADFVFHLERLGDGQSLAFGRRRVDVCKTPDAAPADVTFSYAELGIDPARPIFILNPFAGR